jgi:gamma-glutamylcyclotransferase (GGCT)/AIG2-like uncharacterized protein YtfP
MGDFMKLFLYGASAEGMIQYSRFSHYVQSLQPAETRGTVYRLKVGYPVLIEEGQDLVRGQVAQLQLSDIALELMDQLNGFHKLNQQDSLFWRKEIMITTQDEGIQRVWAYVLNPARVPKDAMVVKDGDWLTHMKEQPALPETLTEKQRHYILKLGRASSREVIPIEMGMYRELLKLEIIVDKGRRLALSKLGHDVFKYLNRE